MSSWSGMVWRYGPSIPPTPAPVPPPNGSAHCSNKLCDTVRPYDILPGYNTPYGWVRPFAFCCFCGDELDVDLREDVA
jgi:hypothetical protein